MENQATLNAISTLAGAIDALNRVQDKESIKILTEKIIELTKKL